MIRFFVLPTETVGIYRGPKYFHWRYDPDPPGVDCLWSAKLYGRAPACVLAADIARPDHDRLALLRDVFAFPVHLDGNIPGSDRSRLGKVLDRLRIPKYWLTGAITYREALRTISCMCAYMLELDKLGGDPFNWGVSLETRWCELSAQQKDWIKGAAWACGYTIGFIMVNTQLQQILKGMADQFGGKPISFKIAEI